jgi:Leucine-rich repeat (LRR) protein
MSNTISLCNIETLDLRSNRISSLAGFHPLPQLKWLSLSSNLLEDIEYLPILPNILYLGLFANYISNRPIDVVLQEVKQKCPKLTHFFLLGNKYSDQEISVSFPLYSLTNSNFSLSYP